MNTQDPYSWIDEVFKVLSNQTYDVTHIPTLRKAHAEAKQRLISEIERVKKDTAKVDRLEVIDDTGRVYVKGSIYSTPVSIELSYQDDGRTLKVFVSERTKEQNT